MSIKDMNTVDPQMAQLRAFISLTQYAAKVRYLLTAYQRGDRLAGNRTVPDLGFTSSAPLFPFPPPINLSTRQQGQTSSSSDDRRFTRTKSSPDPPRIPSAFSDSGSDDNDIREGSECVQKGKITPSKLVLKSNRSEINLTDESRELKNSEQSRRYANVQSAETKAEIVRQENIGLDPTSEFYVHADPQSRPRIVAVRERHDSESKRRFIRCPYNYCTYVTERIFNLRRHTDTMHRFRNDESYVCCDMVFFTKALEKDHKQRVHSHGYECTFDEKCRKEKRVFEKKIQLFRHLALHTGEKPLVCELPNCSYATSSQSNLERHKIHVHMNRRPDRASLEILMGRCNKSDNNNAGRKRSLDVESVVDEVKVARQTEASSASSPWRPLWHHTTSTNEWLAAQSGTSCSTRHSPMSV